MKGPSFCSFMALFSFMAVQFLLSLPSSDNLRQNGDTVRPSSPNFSSKDFSSNALGPPPLTASTTNANALKSEPPDLL